MSTMTSFKRKRIERWCEDVALYLKNGTLCKTVIGNVADDAICGVALVPKEIHEDNTVTSNNVNNSSGNNLNAKVDVALKKATQTLASNDHLYYKDGLASAGGNGNVTITNSIVHGNSFPAVKFAYSHYHEQRRKIDRLVQGLPVLTANGLSSLDRPSSKASTDDHVPIIIVNGEEPVRSSHTRSRSSSQLKREQGHYSGCRNSPLTSSTHANIQHLQNHRNPLEANSNNFRHPNQPTSSPLRRDHSGRKLYDFRVPSTSHVGVTVDPGLSLSTNDRIARIKTAPVPSKNLTRARQRILSRRGNRILEPTSQIPLQNCWAMAELTW